MQTFNTRVGGGLVSRRVYSLGVLDFLTVGHTTLLHFLPLFIFSVSDRKLLFTLQYNYTCGSIVTSYLYERTSFKNSHSVMKQLIDCADDVFIDVDSICSGV